MKKNISNDHITTRIIPGLSKEHRIVSMPYWAWYWLEDFMKANKTTYQGIYNTFGKQQDISDVLRGIAEIHHDYAMREVYNLANDNEVEVSDITQFTKKADKPPCVTNLPRIYKLFGFMACATTLEAVWERRHYKGSLKIT